MTLDRDFVPILSPNPEPNLAHLSSPRRIAHPPNIPSAPLPHPTAPYRPQLRAGLTDYDAALSDLRELKTNFNDVADATTRQARVRREAQLKAKNATASHELLGVERFATAAQIKKAYRTLCLQYHPDKHANSSADARTRAKHKFARIQAAYEKLSASASDYSSAHSNYGNAAHGSARSNPFHDFGRRAPPPPAYPTRASSGGGHGDDEDEEEEDEDEDEYESDGAAPNPYGFRYHQS